jgi:YesN/AraC family two-component response regulator
LEGEADLVFADRTVPVRDGMLIYFRPETPYYFDGNVKVIVLNFDMTRLQSNKKTPLSPSKTVFDFDRSMVFENDPPEELSDVIIIEKAFETEEKLKDCLLHYNYPSALSDAFTSAILKDILCFIAQKHHLTPHELPPAVQKIMLYIHQNYDKDIDNSLISGELGYHSYYLNRLFKKHTRITIHQAIIKERMRVASQLLEATDLSVNAVAAAVGYADHTHFCTAFKSYTGTTPLKFRKSGK